MGGNNVECIWRKDGICGCAVKLSEVPLGFDTSCTPKDKADFEKLRARFSKKVGDPSVEVIIFEAGPERASASSDLLRTSKCPAVNPLWFDKARSEGLPLVA